MVAPGGHVWLLSGGHAWLLPGGHAWLLLGGHVWLLPGGPAWLLLGRHAWDMMRYRDTINEQAVRKLLECILVNNCFQYSLVIVPSIYELLFLKFINDYSQY